MKYLIFDTETVGFPISWTAPVTDTANWPQIVQLAWELYDAQGALLSSASDIIKPVGYHVPYESTRIHGITHQQAVDEGRDVKEVLNTFVAVLSSDVVLVGHNVEFDYNVMGAELLREKISSNFLDLPAICTMRQSVGFCALPGDKAPRLTELYFKLFGDSFADAHNASADVSATAKCFWELKKRGVIKDPVVSSQGTLF
ncbi:3'-5' exonuclease [Candidatus Falkowbacteria bacterium]|nr:3'-5' exonuclease [Candidatus Falkowbacteria bacterium]